MNIAQSLLRSIRSLIAPLSRPRSTFRATPYTEFTFAALGRIAKAGGVVRPVHIGVARRLMTDLGFGTADRRRAIRWFDAGKDPDFDFASLAQACRDATDDREVLNELVLESICAIAWADGTPSAASRNELVRIAALLDVDSAALEAADMRVADYQRRQLPLNLRQAYQMLGVDPRASDAELKLAYRRLISRHHPDKFAADDDPRLTRHASENSAAIRSAFELIRASRNGA